MARSPLLNLYDPYGILEEQAKLGLLPGGDPLNPSRRLTISDLMPQEEKSSMLRALAERGTSGLALASDALDTPGSAVRGILAGKPLSVFGGRVSGRDLLREYDLIGDEDTWGNFAAGLAVEILTDPLTYLNPFAALGKGATTLAGKAGAKAGLDRGLKALASEAGTGYRQFYRQAKAKDYLEALAPELRDEAEKRYRYQFEKLGGKGDPLEQVFGAGMTFSIPGLPGTTRAVTSGLGSAKFLDKALGGAKRSAALGPVLGRLEAMFDPDVQGVYIAGDAELSDDLQQAARKATYESMQQESLLRRDAAQIFSEAESLGQIDVDGRKLSFRDPEVQRAIIDRVEDPSSLKRLQADPVFQAVMQTPELRRVAEYLQNLGPRQRGYLMRAGLRPQGWKTQNYPGMKFLPRQRKQFAAPQLAEGLTPQQRSAYRRNSKIFGAGSKSRRAYMDMPQWVVRGLTMGEDGGRIAKLLRDTSDDSVREILDNEFRRVTGKDRGMYDAWLNRQKRSKRYKDALAKAALGEGKPLADLDRKLAGQLQGMYTSMADTLRNLDPQFADEGFGFFDAPLTDTVMQSLGSDARDAANTKAILSFLKLKGVVQPMAADQIAGGGYTSLNDLAKDFKLDRKSPLFQEIAGGDPANSAVSDKVVAAMKSLAPTTFTSEPAAGIGSALRSYTNLWKGLALLSPAYLTRNLTSGYYSGAAAGAVDPRDYIAAMALNRGNTKPLVNRLRNAYGFEGLSDQQIIDRFNALAGGEQVFGGNVLDDIGEGQARLAPGSKLDKLASRKRPRSWRDWFRVRGVGGVRQTTNPIMGGFDTLNTMVEDTLRGGVFVNQLRRGVDPGAAGDLVRMSQVDYRPQAFTSFENTYLKPLIPFYSFQRGILPSIRNQLLQQPGGLMGQTMRAINRGGQPTEESFAPDYIRSQGSIPLPKSLSPDGKQRYITSFGLPFESAFNLLTPGVGSTIPAVLGGTLSNTLSNIAGQSHPLAKYLIEQATGKQLYSGRSLDDLYSVYEAQLGMGQAGRELQQLIGNLVPYGSRANSLLQQFTDTRLNPGDRAAKFLVNNFLPARVTDIDPEKARDRAARDMLKQVLQETPGARTYENIAVPEDALMAMTPEQQRLYLLYRTIQSEAQKRARERKKQEEAAELLGVPLPG